MLKNDFKSGSGIIGEDKIRGFPCGHFLPATELLYISLWGEMTNLNLKSHGLSSVFTGGEGASLILFILFFHPLSILNIMLSACMHFCLEE